MNVLYHGTDEHLTGSETGYIAGYDERECKFLKMIWPPKKEDVLISYVTMKEKGVLPSFQ